ncbi:sigma-70 family RNA polymerase sigma factor [Aquihabitans sp. McL0605]|uniref:sigma-70 family RNA polymerase sigma factor n=1 Tax=Aquihabitans sp. McL0605 TaxID=3415671 RepID=UPI003CE952E2
MAAITPPVFDEFYRDRLGPTVRQVALLVGSTAVAEELAHDAMIEVYRRWETLDSPAAYLYRCSTNAAFGWLRRRERADRPVEVSEAPPPTEEFIDLSRALTRLPERQRAAVVLRYVADLTEAQIAAALECRPGTVGPLISRGITALRKEMDT